MLTRHIEGKSFTNGAVYTKPRPFENSAKHVPKEGFSPHGVSFGGLPSTSLMWPEKTLRKISKKGIKEITIQFE